MKDANTVVVNREDVDLPALKAAAAESGVNVQTSRYVQRGWAYVFHPSVFDLQFEPGVGGSDA